MIRSLDWRYYEVKIQMSPKLEQIQISNNKQHTVQELMQSLVPSPIFMERFSIVGVVLSYY
jgi:hypothetical protein